MAHQPDELLTISDAAKLLGVPRETINGRINRGDLTVMTAPAVGRLRLVRRSDVERLREVIRPRRRKTDQAGT